MTTYKVGYLVGSLAKASINRKLGLALARLAPRQLVLKEISFAALPLYSYDSTPTSRPQPEHSRTRSREWMPCSS